MLLIGILLLNACRFQENKKTPEAKKENIDSIIANYELLKEEILAYRKTASDQNLSVNHIEERLFTVISSDFYSYWKGTPWTFTGHTETPRRGEIACGYFVTTTLRDAGFVLNRYKFAQDPSSTIINSFCSPASIKRFTGFERLERYLEAYSGNQVFIVGLDNHTGYITLEDGKAYFLHSGFTGVREVKKEKIHESDILVASNNYMIGDLLGNDGILKKWKAEERINMKK